MEEWKDIKGYEGLYQVSNEGRIKALPREIVTRNRFGECIKKYDEKILKNGDNNRGYYIVILYDGFTRKPKQVHRLVAEAFIPNPDKKPCVDHINTVKTDNRSCNLRWVSIKENNNNPLTKQHMSERQLGDKNYWYGKHLTEEQKQKMSVAVKEGLRRKKHQEGCE